MFACSRGHNLDDLITIARNRDAPEATGEEPDDADFDMPKIYEPVSIVLIAYNSI